MATVNLVPDSDLVTDWQLPDSGNRFESFNEGTVSPDDNTFLQSSTNTDNVVSRHGLSATPDNLALVSQIDVNIRAELASGSKLQLNLYHSGILLVSGSPKEITSTDLGGFLTVATVTKSWTGLSLSKSQAASLELEIVKVNV